jgi:hypothetical protein
MALAIDYDGTLAKDGKVSIKTLQAFGSVKTHPSQDQVIEILQDEMLAEITAKIEKDHLLSAMQSRQAIEDLIKKRYTGSASSTE